jgi:hypothetical protein
MKKQIFILTFLSLAFLFAGMSESFGQPGPRTPNDYDSEKYLTGAPSCAEVTELLCTGNIDELHPQAGIPYDYSVDIPTGSTVHWFVLVNNNDVITAISNITGNILGNVDDPGTGTGNYIITSTNYNITSLDPTTSITWKAFDGLVNQVLLVAYVVDAETCTDNVELYRILPVPTFTLDVNAIAQLGSELGVAGSSDAEDCVSPIESAIYTPSVTPLTVPGELVVDYGENWVFFTVTAASFTHSWQPTFEITYSGTQSEVVEAAWAYPAQAQLPAGTWTDIDITGATPSGIVNHSETIGTVVGADDGSGECIVVRVRIDHGVVPENAVADQTIRMAVNGFMYDMVGNNYTNPLNEDLHYADCLPDGFENDWVEYRLTPRPQIINATAAPSFFEDKEDNSDNQGNNN